MNADIGKYLIDILNCIKEIDLFFENRTRKFEDYRNDIILKRAIERNLEVIGEAVNRVLHKNPEIKIENARKIVQFCNIIIHSYDSISDENVQAVVINHLPKLKKEVEKCLDKNFPNFPLI